MELTEFFEVQRNFDQQVGWNKYEQCETPGQIAAFMEHLTLAIVDELGEISLVRKKFLRDGLNLDISTLRKEFVDLFIFVMQGSMVLKMNLEDDYNQRVKHNEQRFIKKHV